MSTSVSWNGSSYTVPATGEEDWGGSSKVDGLLVSIAQNALSKAGGTFALTAEVDFSSTAGLKSLYYKSRGTNVATSGILRLANTEAVSWRDNANSADLPLSVSSSDRLQFNSVNVPTVSSTDTLTNKTLTSPTITGAIIDVVDNSFSIKDNSDATKILKFQVSGVTTGTTRTLTVPDADDTIVTLATTQTLTNKTLDGVTVTTGIAGSGIAQFEDGASGFKIIKAGDPTKGLIFDISGTTALKKTTIAPTSTLDRTITLPDATTTLVGTDTTQTLTNKTLTIGSSAGKVAIYDGSNNLSAESTLAVSRGGTNIASYTAGDLLYASGTTTLSKLGVGANGTFLKVSAGVPAWSSVTGTIATASKTSNYTIASSDDLIVGDSDSAAFTLTLPDCASNAGKVFKIKKAGSVFATANALTVSRAGSDTIFDAVSGLTSTALHTPGEEIEIVSLGSTVWHVVNRRIPAISNSFTPTGTWNTNSTYTGFWQRIGDVMHVDISISLSGNPNSSSLTVNIPSGVTIDTSKLSGGTGVQVLGQGTQSRSGVRTTPSYVMYSSTSAVVLRYFSSSSPTELSTVTQAAPDTFANGDLINLKFKIPITGWNG